MKEQAPNLDQNSLPSTLDIIRIDGRWAQSASGHSATPLINFLDDGSSKTIDLTDYRLVERLDTTVKDLRRNGKMSDKELKRVRWDAQNIGNNIALEVHVFGEFKKI